MTRKQEREDQARELVEQLGLVVASLRQAVKGGIDWDAVYDEGDEARSVGSSLNKLAQHSLAKTG